MPITELISYIKLINEEIEQGPENNISEASNDNTNDIKMAGNTVRRFF